MPTKTYHMHLSIRGALNWDKREQAKALKWMFKEGGEPFQDIHELRDALLNELAKGSEVIPFGKECDNFDWKEGCLGHINAEANAEAQKVS